jgi:hypothetical protein
MKMWILRSYIQTLGSLEDMILLEVLFPIKECITLDIRKVFICGPLRQEPLILLEKRLEKQEQKDKTLLTSLHALAYSLHTGEPTFTAPLI